MDLKKWEALQNLNGRKDVFMEKIKIITDSTSEVTLEEAKEYDITVMGISIIFGDKVYRETLELTKEEFFNKLEEYGDIPKTQQIPISEIVDEFKRNIDSKIIFFTLSSKGSGTNQTVHMAKEMVMEEYPDADITIIDSMAYSFVYGHWVIEAAKMAKEGKSRDEIVETATKGIADFQAYIAVDTLTYLQKGGRISSSAKIIGNLMDIKPILVIEDGLIMSYDKVRGEKKRYFKMVDLAIENADDIANQKVYILHGNAPEKAQALKDALLSRTEVREIETRIIGASVGSHIGPGVVAILFKKK